MSVLQCHGVCVRSCGGPTPLHSPELSISTGKYFTSYVEGMPAPDLWWAHHVAGMSKAPLCSQATTQTSGLLYRRSKMRRGG